MATMQEILDSRESRAMRQKQWLDQYGKTLISYTLNIPGPEKQSDLFHQAFLEGYQELLKQLPVVHSKFFHLNTGSEGLFVVDLTAEEAKEITCRLEDGHPLGRLFDIDVINAKDSLSISRTQLGYLPRQCLLCQKPAKECARSRTHTWEELYHKIQEMLKAYFKKVKALI